jgi:hypothetical protein
MSNSANRSFERITAGDLRRLSTLALADSGGLFQRYERWRPYRSRLMLICLCQGAAVHYVTPQKGAASDRSGGVNDFDVWGFFRDRTNDRPFPFRRHGRQDFGPSKFGRNPNEEARFTGRRVDVLGRSIEKRCSEAPIEAVRRYLQISNTQSARRLAERPVVVLWPSTWRGRVIWKGYGVRRRKVNH